jgi:PBP1b-binding outer membrane lipoprotein LpoB
MKKVLGMIAILAMLVVSCGPSAKEIEEKRINDSIRVADSTTLVKEAEQKIADSLALVAKEDSIKKAAEVKKGKK